MNGFKALGFKDGRVEKAWHSKSAGYKNDPLILEKKKSLQKMLFWGRMIGRKEVDVKEIRKRS